MSKIRKFREDFVCTVHRPAFIDISMLMIRNDKRRESRREFHKYRIKLTIFY